MSLVARRSSRQLQRVGRSCNLCAANLHRFGPNDSSFVCFAKELISSHFLPGARSSPSDAKLAEFKNQDREPLAETNSAQDWNQAPVGPKKQRKTLKMPRLRKTSKLKPNNRKPNRIRLAKNQSDQFVRADEVAKKQIFRDNTRARICQTNDRLSCRTNLDTTKTQRRPRVENPPADSQSTKVFWLSLTRCETAQS